MQQLSGRYKIDSSTTMDPYFQNNGIETYFIVPSSARVTSTHSAYELKTKYDQKRSIINAKICFLKPIILISAFCQEAVSVQLLQMLARF